MEEIITGELYTYRGVEYLAERILSVKSKKDGKWYSAVMYSSSAGISYCREVEDFKAKFEKVLRPDYCSQCGAEYLDYHDCQREVT